MLHSAFLSRELWQLHIIEPNIKRKNKRDYIGVQLRQEGKYDSHNLLFDFK